METAAKTGARAGRLLQTRSIASAVVPAVAPLNNLGQSGSTRSFRTTAQILQNVSADANASASSASPAQPSGSASEVAASTSGSDVYTPRRLAPAEVDKFLMTLQRADQPTNALAVNRKLNGAAALSRELDSVTTLPRQIAHMLLLKELLTVEDLANPAQYWEDSYYGTEDPLQGESAEGEMEGEESGLLAEADEQAAAASTRRAAAVSKEVQAQADAAFGVTEGGGEVSPSSKAAAPTAAEGEQGEEEDGQGVEVQVDWQKLPLAQLGPRVGGALSFVPAGSMAPVLPSSTPSHTPFVPHPMGVWYLEAVAEQISRTAARAQAAAEGLAAAQTALLKAGVALDRARELASALSSPSPSLPEPLKAWLAGVTGAQQVQALGAFVAALRASGGSEAAGKERARILTAAAAQLRAAATCSPLSGQQQGEGQGLPYPPTAGALYSALSSTVGAGVAAGQQGDSFTLTYSAAAAIAAQSLSRAAGTVAQLQASAVRAADMYAQYGQPEEKAVARPKGQASYVGLQAELPTAASLVQAGLGGKGDVAPGELPSLPVRMRGVRAGETPLALSFRLAPEGLQKRRLAAGHVPSMLASLTAVLTPGEWEACLALLKAVGPGGARAGSLFLPYPVAVPAGFEGAGSSAKQAALASSSGSSSSGGVVPGPMPAEVHSAMLSHALPDSHPGNVLSASWTTGTAATAEGGEADILLPASAPASTLSALSSLADTAARVGTGGGAGSKEGLGPSTDKEAQYAAVSAALHAAPSASSARAYLAFLTSLKEAEALLETTDGATQAMLQEALAAAEAAGGDKEAIKAMGTFLGMISHAGLRGEVEISDEEAVAALRDVEKQMPIEMTRRMTKRPSEQLAAVLRAARGYASPSDTILQETVLTDTGMSAPGALSGPSAASAASTWSDSGLGEGRVDYLAPAAATARTPVPQQVHASAAVDGSLARVGASVPSLTASARAQAGLAQGTPTGTGTGSSGTPAVAGLTEEDSGGIFEREEALAAYYSSGTDLLPLLPRAHPADMATTAHLELLARRAASGHYEDNKRDAAAAKSALHEWVLDLESTSSSSAPLVKESQSAADLEERLTVLLTECGAMDDLASKGLLREAQAQAGAGAGAGDARAQAVAEAIAGHPVSLGLPAGQHPDPAHAGVVRVPKVAALGGGLNEEAIGSEGALGLFRGKDTVTEGNLAQAEAGLAALEATEAADLYLAEDEVDPADMLKGSGISHEQRLAGLPWWQGVYEAPSWYRSEEGYEPVHKRMLEALQARDLGAAWALWSEHCRLHEHSGDPDHLALELLMDGCADAGRTDLLFHVLWPRAMAWRMMPTPAMGFILLKGAAREGNGAMAESFFALHGQEGWPVDGRHYAALISAHMAHSLRLDVEEAERREARKAAYTSFNKMLRAGHPANPQVFAMLWGGLHTQLARTLAQADKEQEAGDKALQEAGRKGRGAVEEVQASLAHSRAVLEMDLGEVQQQAHYLWRCVAGSPGVKLPAEVYSLVITTLAQAGGHCLADMERAVGRATLRKVDSKGSVLSARALEAAFKAQAGAAAEAESLAAKRSHLQAATKHYQAMEVLGYLTPAKGSTAAAEGEAPSQAPTSTSTTGTPYSGPRVDREKLEAVLTALQEEIGDADDEEEEEEESEEEEEEAGSGSEQGPPPRMQ